MTTTTASSVPQRALDQLAEINAPTIVAVPPANAVRDLIQLPSGQVRHYGFTGTEHDARRVYLASDDCGLSWQRHITPADSPGSAVFSPISGDYLSIQGTHEKWIEPGKTLLSDLPKGLYLFRSKHGIDGPFTVEPVGDPGIWIPRQPMLLTKRHRWLSTSQLKDEQKHNHPAVLLSDDDGHTWRTVILPTIPPHEAVWPHKGVRWQNGGCEPTVVELSNGRLWMLIRTSLDRHWQSFSDDGGDTWTPPEPSRFWGSITMPTFFRLSDGRVLLFWCNTAALPELDHDQQPELDKWERLGFGEDFFTNRDVLHAAITEDDGQSWIGFREVALNPIRDTADFRTAGGNLVTLDKSQHQAQAVELPLGRVLVSHGQHPLSRRMFIFDPAWLYETERHEDFRGGLAGWSVFSYVKGIAGNFKGWTGHCAYNRRPGPQLVPSPDGESREVLQIARHPDVRLVEEKQGAVWNFPAGKSGEVRLRVWMPKTSQGARICLADRWFNPTDPVIQHFAQFSVELTPTNIATDDWQDLTIRWTPTEATWQIDRPTPLPLIKPAEHGISYVHLQSLAQTADLAGILVREVSARVER